LWDAADQYRANSGLKAQEYSGPILGLIFLRFAEVRFTVQRVKLEKAGTSARRGSRVDEPAAYHAAGIRPKTYNCQTACSAASSSKIIAWKGQMSAQTPHSMQMVTSIVF
jgi:hypothetical protein